MTLLTPSRRQLVNRRPPFRLIGPLFLSCVVVALVLLQPGGAEAKTAEYTRFDVALDLLADGTYHVAETQEVRFSGGSFSLGHREIPLARTTGIDNVVVSEIDESGNVVPLTETELVGLAEAPNTFSVLTTSTDVVIYWAFPPVTSGTKTFLVEYDVFGALRYYPNEDPANQQIWWTAIGSDLTSETPVRASTVTVTLPQPVRLTDLKLGEDGNDIPESHTSDGRVFTWTRDDISQGDEFIVRLQFPPIVSGIDPPPWQASDDAQRAKDQEQDSHQAVIRLIMLGIGLALVAGGGTSLYGVWYMRGRDPHAGLVAEFLPQPPDDLPPGVVGALVDEHADEADVVATLIDLARRGVLKMTDVGTFGPMKRATGHDYIFEVITTDDSLAAFERPLMRAMFGSSPKVGNKARLSDVQLKIHGVYPEVKQGLYDELVRRGLFPRSPESTRSGWRKTAIVVIAVAGFGGLAGVMVEGWWAVFPAVAALALGLVLLKISRSMPRKTSAGAEAAAKWRAFKRYLNDIEAYEKVSESRQIFDRYLPYAIAFGIDTAWVRKFAAVQTATPGWFETAGDILVSTPGGPGNTFGRRTVGSGSGSGSGLDLPDFPDVDLPKMPSLQGVSNKASSGVQSTSSGFSELLNVAGAILSIISAFSGGGGSGGSSGGGGGGFD
jgi:Predicted membrane protein (DUF2207) C-terminal domain/Predicted membrane protein (DUF2207) N-terminal domain